MPLLEAGMTAAVIGTQDPLPIPLSLLLHLDQPSIIFQIFNFIGKLGKYNHCIFRGKVGPDNSEEPRQDRIRSKDLKFLC